MSGRTWFEVAEINEEFGGGWAVLRLDEETLPKAIAVSVGHRSEAAATELAEMMRKTGTA